METEQAVAETVVTTGPRLWIVLVRAYRAMAEVLERGIAEEGLCLSDFFVMEVLLHGTGGGEGPLAMSVIGDKVQLANASMTSAIDRLHERGLVERQTSAGDRRVRLVRLTEQGRAVIERVYARHEGEIEELMEGIGDAERTMLRRGLRQMGLKAKAVSEARQRERREQSRATSEGGCGGGCPE